MNNNRNKKIILILIILTVIFTMMGGSLAYLSWVSSESQKTNITFATGVDFSCSADGGGNITEDDAILVPTEVNNSTSSNYIKREIKVTPTITGKNMNISLDLWLDINKLDSGLSTSENVKYALTTSSTSNSEGVVAVGTFHGMQANEKIELLSNEIYSITTTNTYYLWIWIDAAQTTLETAGQKFNLSLNGSCSMATSIVGNTLSNINNHNNDTVEVLLSNPNDYDIEAVVSYEDEILKNDITVPAETEDMAVEVYVTESVVRKAAASGTNYLTVTVLDNGRETKYNTNAAFTKTIHYLHAGWYDANNFLGQTFDKSTIKSITFVDNNNVPNDAVGSMDVSAEGNGSIMAWYYKASDYSDDNKLYDFYIGSSNGIVYMGPDSSRIFMGLTNMVELDLTYFDTSNATTFFAMFYGDTNIKTLNLSNFDTSNVTNMRFMFYHCYSLETLNLSSFNTSKVVEVAYLFYRCHNLKTLDLSNFDTSNLNSMDSMFSECNSLTELDISNFNTSKVVSMTGMFYNCSSLTKLNLSSFDTSNVTNMQNMFQNSKNLQELNIKNFDFTNVTNNANFLLNVPTDIEITVGNTTAKEWLNTNFSSYTNIIIDNN